jgi:cytochrome c-type biogenesis protein CcmE
MANVERTPGVIAKTVIAGVLLGMGTTAVALRPPPSPPYLMVDDAVAKLPELEHRRLRVHGWVVAGSIVRITPHMTSFTIQKNGQRLAAWYEGALPDTFKDQSEVVVLGTVEGERLIATEIMAKCGGTYDRPRDRNTRFQ